jgi:capsid protein
MGKKKRGIQDAWKDMRADYEMSRDSRFVRKRTGLANNGGSADYHYRTEDAYYRDIEKSRDMDRNDAIIGQIIDRVVANVVQDGFSVNPETGDKGLDDELFFRWKEWAGDPEQCEVSGEMCWHDIERLAFRQHLIDGDALVYMTDSGAVQFIEAHQIQTRTRIDNTFCGVTMDSVRRRDQFWYIPDPVEPWKAKHEQAVPIAARDLNGHRQVFQVYNPKRAYMTRGVTALAPVFYISGMFEDINFAKVVQQQIVSCFAILREMAAGQPATPPSTAIGYGQPEMTGAAGGITQIEGIAPGMEIRGLPGEKLTGFSPNVPNAEYFQHVRLLLQMIGVNLGLPLCLVLMDGSETNFSGWRGAVDEARKGFLQQQRMLVKRLERPVYEAKVRQWMEGDAAMRAVAEQSGINPLRHEWQLPEWSYINPIDDAEADAAQLRNCLTSPRRLHGRRGRNWEVIVDETLEDNLYAISAAKAAAAALNAKTEGDFDPIHWRDILPLVLPAGATMSLQDPGLVEAQTAKKEPEATNGEV